MSLSLKSFYKSKTFLIATISVVTIVCTSFILNEFKVLDASFFQSQEASNKAIENTLDLLDDKNELISQLQIKLIDYDRMIGENADLRDSLSLEKDSIQVLLSQLRGFENTESNYAKLRKEFYNLKAQINNEIADSLVIDTKPYYSTTSLSSKNKSSNKKGKISKPAIANSEATSATSTLAKTETYIVNKPVKLSIIQLSVNTFESKNGKLKESKKASKVNKIEITFTIDKNKNSNVENKKFYMQLLDVSNRLVGDINNVFLSGKQLNYSFETETAFFRTEKINTDLFDLNVKDLKKGVYFLNIFDVTGELLVSKSFELM